MNALGNEFVFDDGLLLTSNPFVAYERPWWEVLTQGYRPLRDLSYVLDRELAGGLDPFLFRLSNIAWHTLAVFAAFAVTRRLTGELLAGVLAALVFAIHPVQTDSVGYIAGRRDVLVGLFYLLAFAGWLRLHRGEGRVYGWLALLAMSLALLCKEMAASFPILCVVYELWARRHAPAPQPLRQRLWFFAAAFGIAAFVAWHYVAIRGASLIVDIAPAGSGGSTQVRWWGGSPLMNALNVAKVLGHYVGLMVYPRTLIADYNGWPLVQGPADPALWLAAARLGVVALLAWVAWQRLPLAALGCAWFFVTLLPVMHFIPHHELLAEHYLYLPSVGFALVLAALYLRAREGLLARGAAPSTRRLLVMAFALLLCLYGLRVSLRNLDWSDAYRLSRVTVRDNPSCARQHSSMAHHLMRMGFLVEAERAAERAIALEPGIVEPHNTLGVIYVRLGRTRDALDQYGLGWKIKQHGYSFLLNLGGLLGAQEQYEASLRAFERILQEEPWYLEAYVSMAEVLKRAGRPEAARATYDRARALVPWHPQVVEQLARDHDLAGEWEQSLALYEGLARAHPEHATAAGNAHVIRIALDSRRRGEALLAEDPDSGKGHQLLGEAWQRGGNISAAAAAYERAVSADAAQAEWWRQLGQLRLELQDFEGAVTAFDAALEAGAEPAELDESRGLALTGTLRFSEAAAAFARAAARDGLAPAEAHRLRSATQRAEQRAQDLAAANIALELGPPDAQSSLHLGRVARAVGWLDAAEAQLQRAARDDCCHFDAWLALADIHDLRDERLAASDAFSQAARVAPSPAHRQLALARLGDFYLHRVEDFDRAQLHYREALAAAPEVPAAKQLERKLWALGRLRHAALVQWRKLEPTPEMKALIAQGS